MKVLFDQGTPAPLRKALINHEVSTAYERGWSELQNGALIAAAEDAMFEVFVTTDKNLKISRIWSVGAWPSSSSSRPVGQEFRRTYPVLSPL